MKKLILSCLFILGGLNVVFPQSCDTLIVNDVYTSCFNRAFCEPIYVFYKLYHGGGDCSRKGMAFKVDNVKGTATPKDYESSGYDEGHLAPAADFAYDCSIESMTFRFYNCIPQTPHLNRGIWKHYETEVRKLSQTDSLLIITGSIFGGRVIPNTHVAIPDFCWKVVQSLSTKNIYYCFIISNNESCKYMPMSIVDLQTRLKYNLPLKK